MLYSVSRKCLRSKWGTVTERMAFVSYACSAHTIWGVTKARSAERQMEIRNYVVGSYFLYVFFSILSPWVPSLFASDSSVVLSRHRNSWKIALMWLKAVTPIYKLLLSSKSWLNEVNLHFKIRHIEDDMDSLAGSLWRQVGNRKSCVLCTPKSTSQLLKLWIVIWT